MSAAERIDKFYTFNKKNEEFQQLLNKEYNKVKGGNAIEQEISQAEERASQRFESSRRPENSTMEEFLESEGIVKPYQPKAFESDVLERIEAQEAEKTAEESAAAPAVPAAGAEETPPAADPESGLTFPARVPPPKALTRSDFQQLCVGFLASLAPHAVATSVPVRRFKYKVNAAGFWRGENARSKDVVKTAVVVLFDQVDNCFCECVDQQALLGEIHSLRGEKERLEAEIRENEPELASTDDLFSELRSWDYASSRNPAYRKLRARLEKLQHTLHQGSRLERIRRAGAADLCYLAVPTGLIAPDEIEAGWGIVYLNADRSFTLVREAEPQTGVEPCNRQFLAQNIAVAATTAVLFMAGVDRRGKSVRFRRFPRKRQVQ